MTQRTAYTYTVLRYCHDVATGEFVNVGVTVFAPESGFLGAQVAESMSRVRAAFPTANLIALEQSLSRIGEALNDQKMRVVSESSASRTATAVDIAQTVLPKDDSALQWTPAGSGIAVDPRAALAQLFRRFVVPESAEVSRQDDLDVWKQFSVELEQLDVIDRLTEKEVSVASDSVRFKHAWKGQQWECLLPLSFDLASSEAMRSKAYEWVGRLFSVSASGEKFRVTFLIAGPDNSILSKAFNAAIATLKRLPVENEVYLVSDASAFAKDFSARIAGEGRRRKGWRN